MPTGRFVIEDGYIYEVAGPGDVDRTYKKLHGEMPGFHALLKKAETERVERAIASLPTKGGPVMMDTPETPSKGAKSMPPVKMATHKQINYAQVLLKKNLETLAKLSKEGIAFTLLTKLTETTEEFTEQVKADKLDVKTASALIDQLVQMDRHLRDTFKDELLIDRPGPSKEGVYKTPDGTMWKVKKSKTAERLYAKRMNVKTRDGETKIDYEYVPGAVYRITDDDQMSLADAKIFGADHGVCCNCGRKLTNEVSVAEGIGPICSGRFKS